MFSTSRYLDDLLNIDKPYSEKQLVRYEYSTEIQLNEANSFDIEAPLLDASLLTGVYSQHALWSYIDFVKLFPLHILSKFNWSTKGLNLLTYTVYLKINVLSHLFLLILKISNHLLFIISTINLFVVLYSTITD